MGVWGCLKGQKVNWKLEIGISRGVVVIEKISSMGERGGGWVFPVTTQ